MPDPAARWLKVKDAFLAAEENEASLDEVCGGDANLRQEVLELLEASRSRPGFLEQAATEWFQRDATEAMPERLGPWRLLREIGRGGMSTVYLCERADGAFEKQAAVKILRTGVLDEELRRRFARERQILARLDHPSIVRLIDGGVTADGRPYLITDFVDGEGLIDHANLQRLNAAARIALFRRVCDAVEYAHKHGVVHRDLKPSNIRVTQEGGPKLLDFGISKLQQGGRPGSDTTQTALPFLTWEYASPEQARGQPLDARTDIYSLGVILYELLEGRLPYEVRGLTGYDAARVICDTRPAPPVLLGPVVLRMLEKDPAKRYPDMTAVNAALANPLRPARKIRWLAAGALAAALGVAAAWLFSKAVLPPPVLVPIANTSLNEYSPALSPDGRSVCYSIQESDTYRVVVKDIASGHIRELVRLPDAGYVRWSPDGNRIAILHLTGDKQEPELSTIEVDGSGLKRQNLRTWWMDWSADGKSVLYSAKPSPSEPVSVYQMRLEDRHVERVTFPRQGYWGDIQLAAAPDGQSIAVTRYEANGDGDIYLISKDGSEVRLTQGHYWINGLVYTPDSKEILAVTRLGGVDATWRIPVDRSAPRTVTVLGEGYAYPSLSRIRPWRLASVKRNWSGEVFTGRTGSGRFIATGESVAISADGERLAFVNNGRAGYEVWLTSAAGGDPVPLTDPKIAPGYGYGPRWAPDARHLAFTVGESEKKIYIADTVERRAWRLTTENFGEANPNWSADSREVYFRSNRSGEPGVYRAPVRGGRKPDLVVAKALEAIPGPDSSVYYITQENSVLMEKPSVGPPRPVAGLPGTRIRYWGVLRDGVFAVDFSRETPRSSILLYRFRDKAVTKLRDLDVPLGTLTSIDVSRDGVRLAWSIARVDSDIFLVPEFR